MDKLVVFEVLCKNLQKLIPLSLFTEFGHQYHSVYYLTETRFQKWIPLYLYGDLQCICSKYLEHCHAPVIGTVDRCHLVFFFLVPSNVKSDASQFEVF
jgi:hypothetical protein